MNRRTASGAVMLATAMLLVSCTSGTGNGGPPAGADTAPPAQSASTTAPQAPETTTPAQRSTAPATPTPAPETTSAAPSAAPQTTVSATPEKAQPLAAEGLSAQKDVVFCPNGSHEGCHTKADMSTYFDHMLALIAPMFDELYGVQNRPANFYFISTGLTGPGPCKHTYSELDYHYCGQDQSINIGQETLWLFYNGIGDAAPAVGIAHEWGHHIQEIMRVDDNLINGPQPKDEAEAVELIRLHSIQVENQADCISGAWVYHAATQGLLEYPDDVADIDAILQAIASSEIIPETGAVNTKRDHGTLKERNEAVAFGYNYGLRGCNGYFPNTPIYNG